MQERCVLGLSPGPVDGCLLPVASHGLLFIPFYVLVFPSYKDTSPIGLGHLLTSFSLTSLKTLSPNRIIFCSTRVGALTYEICSGGAQFNSCSICACMVLCKREKMGEKTHWERKFEHEQVLQRSVGEAPSFCVGSLAGDRWKKKRRNRKGSWASMWPNSWALRAPYHCVTGLAELGAVSLPREHAGDWSIIVQASLFGLCLDYPEFQCVGRGD